MTSQQAAPATKATSDTKLVGEQPSTIERVANPGAHAIDTALLIQETAEKVARETADRISKQYESLIAELDKRASKALKKVRDAAKSAQPAETKSKEKAGKKSGKKSGKAKVPTSAKGKKSKKK